MNATVNYVVGFVSGILIYITMFIFGAMVMRGVMEEKTNRIAEVMVSSVKPFQLMMGKILGIAAVGLTQFLLWVILIMSLSTLATALVPHEILAQAGQANQHLPPGMSRNAEAYAKLAQVSHVMGQVNWVKVIGCFVFYFLAIHQNTSAIYLPSQPGCK